MLLSHLKFSISYVCKGNNLLVPNSGYVVQLTGVGPYTSTPLSASSFCRKKVPSLFSSVSMCIMPHGGKDLHPKISVAEAIYVVESCLKEDSDALEEQSLTEGARGVTFPIVSKSARLENEREMERRRKIGSANKGRVPWNKGRKHSEETREIIRRRTKEAMKDPKVIKKISECPRSLSEQTKAKISMSHRKIWHERLKWKRSREKMFQFWADCIAGAAKTGSNDQQELEWDSFEKIKGEIQLEQIQQAEQNAKASDAPRKRAGGKARKRKTKKKGVARKQKKPESKGKVVGETKRNAEKKSDEDAEDLCGNREFDLRRNLNKIRKQKSRVSYISNQYERTWENLDVKLERTEVDDTLADQIRLAKYRRAEFSPRKP